jgi:lysozyme
MAMTKIKGMDVSHHNGTIDWEKAKADGIKFVMIKATEGVGYKFVDYFRQNAPLALGNGIDVGAYHYGTFSSVPEAIAQARYFESVIKDYKLTYPVALDLEENKAGASKKQLTDAAIAFVEYLENKGYFVLLYTGDNFLDTQLEEERLKNYAWWIARYGAEPKNDEHIWQYSSTSHVNGVIGNTDVNWAYRDFASEIANKNKPVATQKVAKSGQVGVVTATMHTVIRKGPNAVYDIVRSIEKGEAYKCYGQQDGWYNIGAGWVYSKCSTFKSK